MGMILSKSVDHRTILHAAKRVPKFQSLRKNDTV